LLDGNAASPQITHTGFDVVFSPPNACGRPILADPENRQGRPSLALMDFLALRAQTES